MTDPAPNGAVANGTGTAGTGSAGTAPGEPVVVTRGLSKTFPGQRALSDVGLSVLPGEIHALLGQNGSGKSTLIKILAGVYTPDPGGSVRVAGESLPLGSPRDSHRMGLRFVHQALGIIEELSAVENVALGFGYRRRRGFIDWKAQRAKTAALLGRLNASFDLDCPVATLRPVDRSAVAIARALDDDGGTPRLLVLDEPTAALPPAEVEALFSLVRQTRAAGTAVVYVSHRLDEILQIADRASVLRDGVLEDTRPIADLSHGGLAQMILGVVPEAHRAPTSRAGRAAASGPAPEVVLKVRGLTGVRLTGFDLDVARGEVVGVAGLTGSGREELAAAIVGASPSSGRLEDPSGRVLEHPTPRQAKDLGVVLVLPNRAKGAAAKELTVRENLVLPAQGRYSRHGLVAKRKELGDTRRWIDALDIRPRDPERAYAQLSGGNQQKVIFGKWLNLEPKVMVLDDPTSGVDIGARRVIYQLIREAAGRGTGFVICSSDVDDLVAVCDRVVVLRGGRSDLELLGEEITDTRITVEMLAAHAAAGDTAAHAAAGDTADGGGS